MATAQSPAASVADRGIERCHNRDVASIGHGVVCFPRLQTRAYPGGSPFVFANAIIGEELDTLEKVRPYAQRSSPGRLGDEIMPSIPVKMRQALS